jgi:hypothetical protein
VTTHGLRAHGVQKRLIQTIDEKVSIGKLSQAIVTCLVLEFYLAGYPLGDIANYGDYHESVDGFKRIQANFNGKLTSILSASKKIFPMAHEFFFGDAE